MQMIEGLNSGNAPPSHPVNQQPGAEKQKHLRLLSVFRGDQPWLVIFNNEARDNMKHDETFEAGVITSESALS